MALEGGLGSIPFKSPLQRRQLRVRVRQGQRPQEGDGRAQGQHHADV